MFRGRAGGGEAARRIRWWGIIEELQRSRYPFAAGTVWAPWGSGSISTLPIVDDVPAAPPPRALIMARKPPARGRLKFSDTLLGRILNEVPALPVPPGRADGSGPDGGAAERPIARHAARRVRRIPARCVSYLHQSSPLGDEPPWEVPVGPWRKEVGRSHRRVGQDQEAGRGDGGTSPARSEPAVGPPGHEPRPVAIYGSWGKPVPYRHLRESAASNTMSGASMRRRTQVAKGEVCKTSIQRFESARRLHPEGSLPDQIHPPASLHPSPGRIIQLWTSTN